MPKRRKVGNMLALAILATLAERPGHPYQLAALIRDRGKDQDMEIKWGSLYTVVQNLEKHGFIRAAGNVKQGGRPERTVYEITETGRGELVDWVRELLSESSRDQPKFEAGLSVMATVGPDEAIALLRRRVAALDAEIAARRCQLVESTGSGLPRMFLIEVEYDVAMRQADADWVRGFLKELEDGSFPGVDLWRSFHETGELPPELKALAERSATGKDG